MKNYELIEHTADVGIRVKGKDLKEIFQNAALAMFDIMSEKKPRAEHRAPCLSLPVRQASGRQARTKHIIIKQEAENLDELFINWLNELLSLSAVKELIFTDFDIKRLDEKNLEARLTGCGIENYKVNTEIKAATYHELKIEKIKSGWQAEVILDV